MKVPPTADTRFFLTHFLAETATIKEKTRQKIEELQRQRAFVPTIVLHEVYKFEYETAGVDVAGLRIDSVFRSNFRIVDLDTPIRQTLPTVRDPSTGSKTAPKHAQNEQFPQENSNFTKARLYKEGVGVPSPNPRKS